MRSPRSYLFFSLFLILGIGLVITFSLLNKVQDTSSISSESASDGNQFWLIFIPVTIIILLVGILPILRSAFPGTIKNGVKAEASILKVWDTGVRINNNPRIGMLLEVRPPNAAAFEAEVKKLISPLNPTQYQPGQKVQVVYDPNNPKRIDVVSVLGVDEKMAEKEAKESAAEKRLTELNQLYEKGLITLPEYEKKRDEIIQSL
jgi:hypothetical protein